MSDAPGLLKGVRVLTFGAFVAGNTAARLLSDLGAEVVKIEAKNRPEVLRMPAYSIGRVVTEPSGIPNSIMFASLSRGLHNVSLDMGTMAAQGVFRRLVGVSDVVIENFGGPVLDRWGCGYRQLLEHNPALVMLSLSGYGRTGPRANYLAYAITMASYLGLASEWGYAHGTLTDYLVAASGALAAAAALGEARLHGKPTYLDVGQIDAVTPMLASIYASPLNPDQDRSRSTSNVEGSWLSGIFPSNGADQWLAVDIEDRSDWQQLCEVLQRPDLAAYERVHAETLEPQLSEALGAWVASCSAHLGMHHLQRAGLAAAVVQDLEGLWFDPQLRARGFHQRVDQPDFGPVTYPASAQRWSATPGGSSLPPARLGEHTRGVLRGWLDMSDEEMASLQKSHVIYCAE